MIRRIIIKIRHFFQTEIWKSDTTSLSKRTLFLYRFFRVWVIAISEFDKDKIGEKASALTYFSLLSIVPVAAMAFGIATIFGLEEYLRNELETLLSGQQEVLEYTVRFAERMLATSSGGLISGIGALFLIYAVVRLLHNIETAFNDIWDTKQGRSLRRKMTDYISFILLAPLMLIISSATTVFITSSMQNVTESIPFLGFIQPGISFLIQLIPYTLIWVLLFLFYIIFPNAPVRIIPALIAGILTGTAYQLTQWAWLEGQVFLNRYSVIYGSFAALPLFLIWLQLSWTIILFGAEFAFAIQNEASWAHEKEKVDLNRKTSRIFALLVLRAIIQRFESKDLPTSFEGLNKRLNIPRRFIREIVHDLEASGLLIRVAGEPDEEWYIPGMSVQKIDVYTVYSRLESLGKDNVDQYQSEDLNSIIHTTETLDQAIAEATSGKLVRDL